MRKVYFLLIIIALIPAWLLQGVQAQNPKGVDEQKNRLERVECFEKEERELMARLTAYPKWVAQLIIRFQREPVGNPPREIWQYIYKGQIVYGVSEVCCDAYYTVYDINKKEVCAPSGGFVGRGDGRCPDFYTQSTNKKLVWKDARTR